MRTSAASAGFSCRRPSCSGSERHSAATPRTISCTRFEGKGSFRDLLLADTRVAAALGADELDRLLDPSANTGLAGPFVDRVVREARKLAS